MYVLSTGVRVSVWSERVRFFYFKNEIKKTKKYTIFKRINVCWLFYNIASRVLPIRFWTFFKLNNGENFFIAFGHSVIAHSHKRSSALDCLVFLFFLVTMCWLESVCKQMSCAMCHSVFQSTIHRGRPPRVQKLCEISSFSKNENSYVGSCCKRD